MASILEHHNMARIAQKRSSTRHRGQDTALACDPQILFDPRQLGHESSTKDSD